MAHCLASGIQRAMHENALRDEELRYRALAESTAQFVWKTDAEGQPSGPLAIATWRALTGQTAEDFEGLGWLGAIHPDDRPQVAERWSRALSTHTPVDVTYRLRLADGSYRRFRVRGIPIEDEQGNARDWIGVGTDVEDELRAEERRMLLERTSRVLVESLDVGTTLESIAQLMVPDLADICLAYLGSGSAGLSRAAAAAADPAKADIARALQQLPPLDLTRLTPEFRAVRTGRSVLVPELTDGMLVGFAAGPGHLRLIRALEPRSGLAVPLVARGQLLGALLFLMAESGRRFGPEDLAVAEEIGRRTGLAVSNAQLFDESEWARAEAVAANQAKSQFLATMSHELRTPLNAISGYASLIEDGVYGPVTDRQRDALERLRRSQHHLLRLVEGVLDYARIEAHVVSYEITDVQLGDALASADALVAPQLGAKGIDFTCDFRACNHTVRADAEKLGQILLNLLSNAIKFTERGGHISIDCELRENEVAIHVTDSGIGIPPEHAEAIFQPFVQVRGGLTRTTEGAGLGLPISRDLARGMGGDLTVQSMVGQGSTFTLTLPRARTTGD
jgi:PAS domain S-box-containing protein